MPNPPTVFISYRQQLSGPVARQIHDRLQDMGADAFFDVDDIHLGDNWRAKLTAQLAARDYFIVILHPATLNELEWVAREIEMALDLHKPIIPIFTDGFSYIHPNVVIPPAIARLKDIQGIEYNYKRPQPTFDALAQTLNLSSQPTPAVGTRRASSAAAPEPPIRPGMSDTLKAAIITGIFAVIVAVVTIVPNLLPKAAETPTPPPATQAAVIASNTPPPTDAPSITPLPPTSTNTPLPPTPTPTNTPIPPSATPTPSITLVPPTATNTSIPPTPASTSSLLIGEQAVIAPNADGYLNLRSAVGRDNTVLAQVIVGSVVLVLDGPTYAENGLWWKLRAPNGVIGWTVETIGNQQSLMSIVITATPMPTNPLPTVPATATEAAKSYPCEATIVTKGDATSLRVVYSSPSKSTSPRNLTLQVGMQVYVVEIRGEQLPTTWYRIDEINGNTLGWVESQYLSLSPSCLSR